MARTLEPARTERSSMTSSLTDPTLSVKSNASHYTAISEAARKAVFAALITEWIAKRRLEQALSREDIAALDALGRLLAQRHSLIDNLGHYFAAKLGADVAA